jgi:hypothetical protein
MLKRTQIGLMWFVATAFERRRERCALPRRVSTGQSDSQTTVMTDHPVRRHRLGAIRNQWDRIESGGWVKLDTNVLI